MKLLGINKAIRTARYMSAKSGTSSALIKAGEFKEAAHKLSLRGILESNWVDFWADVEMALMGFQPDNQES